MLGDIREPLRADEVGGRLDERREASDGAVGNGRDRSDSAASRWSAGPETARRVRSPGRARPKVPRAVASRTRRVRAAAPRSGPSATDATSASRTLASRRMAPSSSSRRIRWRSDSAAAIRRSRDASRSASWRRVAAWSRALPSASSAAAATPSARTGSIGTSLVAHEDADLETRPGVAVRRCAPTQRPAVPPAGRRRRRTQPPSSSPYPMTRVGSSRAAASRSRSVVASARSPRSITRRVRASRDHPPQRRSIVSAAVLTMSTVANSIRAVAKSTVPAATPAVTRANATANVAATAAAPRRPRRKGPAVVDARNSAVAATVASRAVSSPTHPTGDADHGEAVTDRDDGTLDRCARFGRSGRS